MPLTSRDDGPIKVGDSAPPRPPNQRPPPPPRLQPEYREEKEWDYRNAKVIQKTVGTTMDVDGKVWFWCQTFAYSVENNQLLDSLFGFVEKVRDPTMQRYRGTYEELGEALFQRGENIAKRVLDDSLTQEPPWDDHKDLHYRVELSWHEALKEQSPSLADYGFSSSG